MANLQTIHRFICTVLLIAFAASTQACGYLEITCIQCYQTYSYIEVDRSSIWLERGEYNIQKAPTCTQPGTVEFKCYHCGTIANAFDILPALGHDWGDATYVDPTCTTGGHDQHTCTRCGATETYNEVAALGHNYGEDHICTRCSEDYGTFSYIGTNGQTASCSDYKFIVSSGNVTLGNSSYDGWYAVYGDVSLTKLKFLDKTVNLILLDGAKLTIETTTQTDGIEVGKPMNIYGQSGGTGRLVINAGNAGIWCSKDLSIYGGTVTSTGRASNGIQANGNLTIAGGTVRGTSTLNGNGIFSILGTLSVTGGNVTATGGNGKFGMSGDKGINLSWANTATSITSSSYGGSVTLAKSFLGSDGNIYTSGAVADPSVLNDVTLTGADILYDASDNDVSGFTATTNVSLYGRTLYRDGDWNTLCLPFPLPTLTGTPLEGFTVMELDGTTSHLDGDGTLYLNFNTATAIEAGRPYIVKKAQFADDAHKATFTITGGNARIEGSYVNLMDGNTESEWAGQAEPALGHKAYIEYQADAPVYVTNYTLTTTSAGMANPTEWTLYAKKNAGDGWAAIDSRNADANGDDALPNSNSSKGYDVQHPGLYQYFRFEVTRSKLSTSTGYMHLAELSMQAYSLADAEHLTNPMFQSVTVSNAAPTPVESSDGAVRFVGSYSPVSLDANDKSVLYLGAANTLYYPNADMTLGSCRALFRLNGASAQVRDINLNFDEQGTQTKIGHTEITEITERANAWYTINGVKLEGKPTQKGLYIYGNKKVVIK